MKKFKLAILLAIAGIIASDRTTAQCSGTTSISTNFASQNILAHGQLWFASGLTVTGSPTYPLTIYFHNQTISSSAFSLSAPNGELILDPSYTHPVTIWNGTMWVTTAPPGDRGNYFIAADYYEVPSTISGGLTPVTWSGTFTASEPGVSLTWQWWSAAYPSVGFSITEDAISPSDCGCGPWGGYAGTPGITDDFSRLGIDGDPTTSGGTDYRYTGSASVTACDTVSPTVSISASATSVCTGDSITFTASAVNGGTSPSYQWKLNGGNVGTNSSTYTLRTPVNHEEIYLVLTSSDSFALSPTTESNLIIVTVNDTPAAATISGGTTVCTGGTLALSASAAGGAWSSGNTAIGTISGSGTLTGVAFGTTAISYTLTNSCGTATATKTVTVNLAGFTISGTVTSPTCNGYTNGSVVTAITGGDGTGYSYSWSNGGTSYGEWGVGAGTYTVTATSAASCQETAAFTVTQPDAMSSSYSVTDVYAHGGDNGAIYYGVAGGAWPYTYSWSNGATTQNITSLTAGTYVVTVTDANSCSLTNWFDVHQPYGCGSRIAANGASNGPVTAEAEAEAFPNPFSSEATISFSTPEDGRTSVEVYSAVNGDKVATIFNDNTSAGQEYSCKLSGEQLASGVYLYKVNSADKNLYTGRIVLVK